MAMATTPATPATAAAGETPSLLLPSDQFAPRQPHTLDERLNAAFDRLVAQTGLELNSPTALSLIVAGGLVTAGFGLFVLEDLLIAGMGLFLGIGSVMGIFMALAARRRRLIERQLPEAMELLARGIRAGRSLTQAIELLGSEAPSPIAGEFKRVDARMKLGMPLPAALADLPRRAGVVSMQIVVTALSIHQQTGGDITQILDQLARTLRERLAMQQQFRAATAGSRFSVIFMLTIGPAVVAFLVIDDPAYLRDLLSATGGRTMVAISVILQVVGSFWVWRIMRTNRMSS
jgi:tight adherence protein B